MKTSLKKGYMEDAGADIILSEPVIFKSHKMTVVDLGAICTPAPECMGYLVARTSAAKKGLMVQSCPIDSYYEGPVHAIVYNASDEDIVYKEDEAFCQLVIVPIKTIRNVPCKREGRRSDSCFGGTDEKH